MLKPRLWRRPLVTREHGEAHRQPSWLELFFDLSFVVAVAQAAGQLEELLAADRGPDHRPHHHQPGRVGRLSLGA